MMDQWANAKLPVTGLATYVGALPKPTRRAIVGAWDALAEADLTNMVVAAELHREAAHAIEFALTGAVADEASRASLDQAACWHRAQAAHAGRREPGPSLTWPTPPRSAPLRPGIVDLAVMTPVVFFLVAFVVWEVTIRQWWAIGLLAASAMILGVVVTGMHPVRRDR